MKRRWNKMSLQGIVDPAVRAYFKKKYWSGGNSANDGYFLICEDENESKGTFNIEGMRIGVHLGDKILTAEEAIGANMIQKMVIDNYSSKYYFSPNIESAEEAFGLTFIYYGDVSVFVSGKKGTYNIDGMVIELPLDGTYGLKVAEQSVTTAFIAIGKA